ncbi:hypothetical protein PLEOSDRAFT_156363 [Pleurotus ostreatus PC15]|uniref:Uncharacterized protein n=1 Tax=Pleurotus ostreatus (strain PC15) TaxID=1137138 RepID=A0A067NKM0_PLEO1|nr:hypothetical protein PLEOSDRAFT_156363 [Pleurotus ostreatus PC15]
MELVAATGTSVAVAEAMLIIKVYAINHRKRWVLLVLLLVWLGQFGSMAYSVSGSDSESPQIPNPKPADTHSPRWYQVIATGPSYSANQWICNLNTSAASYVVGPAQPAPPFSPTSHSLTRTLPLRSPSSHFQLGFIVPLVIFDCTAFTLTFLGLSSHSAPGESMFIGAAPLLPQTSISAHVLRDGLFYFLILCMVNISWAISSSFLDPDFQNIVHLPSSAFVQSSLSLSGIVSVLIYDYKSSA